MASIMIHAHKSIDVSLRELQGHNTPTLTLMVDGAVGDEVCIFINTDIDTFLDNIDTAIRAFLDNRK